MKSKFDEVFGIIAKVPERLEVVEQTPTALSVECAKITNEVLKVIGGKDYAKLKLRLATEPAQEPTNV